MTLPLHTCKRPFLPLLSKGSFGELSMSNILGIDLGGKHVGLAVVQQPENRVLWCGTVHLSDKIKELYDQRRMLRRARRTRGRYRKPKVPKRGGGAAGKTKPSNYVYKRAKDLNQSLRTKCKYVDPETGEACEKNTPKLINVRHLLIEDILGFKPFAAVPDEYKQAIRDVLTSNEDITLRRERLKNIFSQIDVSADLKEQITDIVFNEKTGRAEFCREHLLSHHTQTQIPTQAVWLPPSIKLKQEFVLKQIRQHCRPFGISKIVIERANFDLQKITKGVIDDPTEYQQGFRYGFRNTRAALLQEYDARCCYCGKTVLGMKWHVDHIDPRRTGEINRWDNLAIACEKCNHKKGGRSPKDAGMQFAVITKRIAGRMTKRTLAPRPIEGSKIHKYMTQTDQGIRVLKNSLKAIFRDAAIEETFGYETSAWRQLWELEKGKDTNEHHNDAIVIASAHVPETVPLVEVAPVAIKHFVGGRRLFDLNPVSRKNNGRYYQRTPVLAEVGGISPSQLKAVVSGKNRKLLKREFERYNIKGKKTLPPKALERLPFKSVRLAKPDCTDSNVRFMKTGHRYKVSNVGGTRVNESAVVYQNTEGKLATYVIKNRLAFGPTGKPGDFVKRLYSFKAGDAASNRDGLLLGKVIKIGSNGTLTFDSGKTKKAHACKKDNAESKAAAKLLGRKS